MRREKLEQAFTSCPVYGITSNAKDVLITVKQMLASGIRIIQYREKHKSPKIQYHEALVLRRLTRQYNALLIIDDYVDLAMAVHADGIHIGQGDLPPKAVRRIVGPNMIIGWSTHGLEDLKAANRYSHIIDYIGVGPVYATQTKPNAHPVGLSYVNWAATYSKVPTVAIGGIDEYNVQDVWSCGPTMICAVSAVVESSHMKQTVQQLLPK